MKTPNYNLARFLSRESISSFLPWLEEVDQGIFYLQDGSLGFTLELAPLPVATEETANIIEDLLNTEDFPAGTVIEIFLLASPDISFVLNRWESLKLRGGIFEKIKLTRSAFYRDSAKKGFFSDMDFAPRDFRLFFSVNTPPSNIITNPLKTLWMNIIEESKRSEQKSLEDIKRLRDVVQGSLGVANIPSVSLQSQGFIELLSLIFNSFNIEEYPIFDPNLSLRNQIVNKDTNILLEDDRILINSCQLRMFTVSSYPPQYHISRAGRLIGDDFQMTQQIGSPFFISLKVIKEDFEKVKKAISLKSAVVQKQSLGILSSLFPKVAIKAEDYAYTMSAIEAKKMPARGFYSVGILARNEYELERATQHVKSIYRLNGFTLHAEKVIQLPVFLVSLPLSYTPVLSGAVDGAGRKFLRREYTALTNNFANVAPLEAEWKGSTTPTLIFFGRKGQIMSLDLFDSKTGYNALIVGETGGGKSFLANEIIVNYLSQGSKIWVVELGKSYENTCRLVEGNTIIFREDSSWNLNPFFSIIETESEEFSFITPIFAKMASPSRDLTDIEKSFMEQAIVSAWKDKGTMAGVEDVRNALVNIKDPRAIDLSSMLFPWTPEGRFGRFLSGKRNLDMTGPFIFMDLDGLKDKREVLSVVLLLLMFRIRREVFFGNPSQKKIVMLDEAWDLLNDPMSAEFMERSYRTFRKYYSSIISLVQGLGDVFNNPRGRVIVENSAYRFLLPQKPESLEMLKREAKLDVGEYELSLIKDLRTIPGKFSEVYIQSSYGSGIGRLIVDRFTYYLYTTKPDERAHLERLIESGLSVEEAIEQVIA